MVEKKNAPKKAAAKKTPAKKTPAKKTPAKKTPAKKKDPSGVNTAAFNKTPLKTPAKRVQAPKPVSAPAPKTYEDNIPAPVSRLEIMRRWFRRAR
jgi:hypothetical protein